MKVYLSCALHLIYALLFLVKVRGSRLRSKFREAWDEGVRAATKAGGTNGSVLDDKISSLSSFTSPLLLVFYTIKHLILPLFSPWSLIHGLWGLNTHTSNKRLYINFIALIIMSYCVKIPLLINVPDGLESFLCVFSLLLSCSFQSRHRSTLLFLEISFSIFYWVHFHIFFTSF